MSVTTLTKRIVATTQPKERAYELRDAQVRGLLLRVQPSGHKAWVVTWEHGKRRTLGSAGHLTLDQARDIARKIIAEYIQTGLPSIAKPAMPKMTLAVFLSDHYSPWARSELKGADKYINRLERVFQRALVMPMSGFSSAWLEGWWRERLQTKARPNEQDSPRRPHSATSPAYGQSSQKRLSRICNEPHSQLTRNATTAYALCNACTPIESNAQRLMFLPSSRTKGNMKTPPGIKTTSV